MKELCFEELWQKYGQYDDWYRGGSCKGSSCPDYGKCKGNAEFDKLIKRPVTDYEATEAVNRERRNGVFDRERNYY